MSVDSGPTCALLAIRYVSVPLDTKRSFYTLPTVDDLDTGVPETDCHLLPMPVSTMPGATSGYEFEKSSLINAVSFFDQR